MTEQSKADRGRGRKAEPRCAMPTGTLRMCSRSARYLYVGRGGIDAIGFCAQHDRAGGHSAMLRPRPWEWGCKLDLAAGIHVGPERGGCGPCAEAEAAESRRIARDALAARIAQGGRPELRARLATLDEAEAER